VHRILNLLSEKDKKVLIGLLIFSILVSIIEVVGISAIMPFIQMVTDNEIVHSNQYYSYIYKFLAFESEVIFIISFGMVLIFFYIFRSVVNLVYVYSLAHFTQSRYHSISNKLFQHYMEISYQSFTNNNSSTMTKNIVNEAQNLTQVISSLLFMISEIFIFLFLYLLMLYIDWRIALALTFIVALNALLMLKTISKKIKSIGLIRAKALTSLYEDINSSFGNFKIVKLQYTIEKHLEEFKKNSGKFTRTNIFNITLTNMPRLFLEAVGFGMVVFIITYLVWKYDGNIVNIMPTITIFVFSLYRLMPSLNRISTGYNEILFYGKSLDIITEDLSVKVERIGEKSIEFGKEIIINNLGFAYNKNEFIFKDVCLSIKKGSSIAFVGKSGSGKSTLVDVIMGLHQPTVGDIYSDGILIDNNNLKSWRKKIGYIPQFVYLFDGTVGENIAFGMNYDKSKVDFLLKKVRLYDFLKEKDGQDTLVGENGAKLSGGQRQRVAIARALYTDADILVLDEATSALDSETEKQIMKEIYNISIDKTLIIIAHRLSTLDKCEYVYEINNGRITYNTLKNKD
jgi:ATP-binding cassette, subfamily B, bacterial PglK